MWSTKGDSRSLEYNVPGAFKYSAQVGAISQGLGFRLSGPLRDLNTGG